ncbi:MAG: hypothetical protein KDA89_10435 [Planctomycetaceae bacterium]|nr:hypothetical protein [Planctomycetaceae bacterium]
MSRRFKVCLILWIAVVAVSAWCRPANAQTLNIVPRSDSVVSATAPATAGTPIPLNADDEQKSEVAPAPSPDSVISPIPMTEAPAVSGPVTELPAGEVMVDAEWTIAIIPALKIHDVPPTTAVAEGDCADCRPAGTDLVSDYERVYRAIPFNRPEYRVNPSYRHDSTMELLTGNARHKTIVRHDSTRRPVTTTASPTPLVYPATFIRPGIRLNYYRYFPSLSPYLSWWNFNGVF